MIMLTKVINSSAQTASMSLQYGTKNTELNQVLSFENINTETLIFKAPNLKGTYYQVFVKEYLNGKFIKKDTLFDGSELDLFINETDSLRFNFYSKTANNTLKLQLQEARFQSKKLLYNLNITQHEYVLKDFLTKKTVDVPIGEPFYIFAIITPTIHKDGSGSYCQVAYSKTNPENFGTEYNIQHYFLIEMVFK